jgi:hypothetical protein
VDGAGGVRNVPLYPWNTTKQFIKYGGVMTDEIDQGWKCFVA